DGLVGCGVQRTHLSHRQPRRGLQSLSLLSAAIPHRDLLFRTENAIAQIPARAFQLRVNQLPAGLVFGNFFKPILV
ncbi:MAG: hypothetical protein ONA90_04735, partial [candidate division KSB1 bacterium]|nr:hypothetical protein [candidate division KSB1 bacterium]